MSAIVRIFEDRLQLIRDALYEAQCLMTVLGDTDPENTEGYVMLRRGLLARITDLTEAAHALTCSDRDVGGISKYFEVVNRKKPSAAELDAIREVVDTPA
jgi:hypothetical protein